MPLVPALLPALLLACTARSAEVQVPWALRPEWEGQPGGTLYGFWGLNGLQSVQAMADLRQRLGMTVFQVASEDPAWVTGTLLPTARAAGVRVNLRLAGDHPAYTRGGDFDLAAWQAAVRRWEGAGLEPWIADGTLVGHMLLDDILTFEGRDPTAAELDAMAATSEALWPDLLTWVRAQATHLPTPEGGRYVHLDACVNQYGIRDGDIHRYAVEERERALELGLGIINGLNLLDGGDGRAGRPGWRGEGFHPMTAEEIDTYGRVLATMPELGMFLAWEYDAQQRWPDGTVGADYLADPRLQAALARLGRLVAAHPPVPLRHP